MNNLITRTLSGIVFVAAIAGALLGGPLTFYLVFLIITGWCQFEFYKLASSDEANILMPLAITAGVIIFSLNFLVAGGYIDGKHLLWLLLLPPVIWVVEMFRKSHHPFRNLTYTLTGLVYPTLLMASVTYLAFISGDEHAYSHKLVLGLFVLIWVNDTFAYIAGVGLGKHKLLPGISPKKSWEGWIGGTLFTLLAAWVMFMLQGLFPLIHWLALAVIVSVTGTLGDLGESFLKRSAGVKDSGNIIPGHGGILDRMDAALFIFPSSCFYLSLTLL